MRMISNFILVIVLALLGFVLAGPVLFYPKPRIDSAVVARVQQSADLDQYLRTVESPYSDEIKPGLEKTIVWSDPEHHEKTPLSIVYFHGWSSSRMDTAPLISTIAHRLKANVFYTRLKAHGMRRPDGFGTLRMQDLIDDGREALAVGQRLGERVVVIGMSTGATLATAMAFENRASEAPALLVLMSPNFMPARREARFLTGPLGFLFARAAVGTDYTFAIENAKHAEYWTTTYPSDGLVPMIDLVNYTNSLDLSEIHIPTLVLYTTHDLVVSTNAIHRKYEEFGSIKKDLINVQEATRHELVGDLFGPAATVPAADAIVDFTREALAIK